MERVTLLLNNESILQSFTSIGIAGISSSLILLTQSLIRHLSHQKRKVILGVAFGVAAVFAVLTAGQPSDGVILFSRSAIIAVAALAGGPVTGGIAAAMALATRLMIDTTALGVVLSTTMAPLSIGLLCHHLLFRKMHLSASWGVIATAAGAALLTPLTSFLSDDLARGWPLLLERGPALAAVIFSSALFLGLLVVLDESLHKAAGHLRDADQKLAATALARSAFLRLTSHELRTPLAAIIGYARMLGETTSDGGTKEKVSIISTAGKDLLVLLNMIHDLTRLDGSQQESARNRVAPRSFLAHVDGLYAPLAREKGIEFRTHLDAGVPSFLLLDDAMLRQILSSLVGNGVTYTSAGEVTLDLSWEGAETTGRGWLTAAIEDTGEGIPSLEGPRSCAELQSDDLLSIHAAEGRGLGPAIAQRLAAKLGGTLTAASRAGGGARFTLRVPADCAAVPPDAEAVNEIRLDGMRVLVVDDVALLAQLTRLQLQAAGAEVAAFTQPVRALEAFASDRYDAAVIDLQMPEMTGTELAHRVRGLPNRERVALVALTADVSEDSRLAALCAGFDSVLHKPTEPEVLCRRLLDTMALRSRGGHRRPEHLLDPLGPRQQHDQAV